MEGWRSSAVDIRSDLTLRHDSHVAALATGRRWEAEPAEPAEPAKPAAQSSMREKETRVTHPAVVERARWTPASSLLASLTDPAPSVPDTALSVASASRRVPQPALVDQSVADDFSSPRRSIAARRSWRPAHPALSLRSATVRHDNVRYTPCLMTKTTTLA